MLPIDGKVKRRTRSVFPIVVVLAAVLGGTGCMEEAGGWSYCIALLLENHTSHGVELTYSIGPENSTEPIHNDTQTLGPRGPGDSIGDLYGSMDREHRLNVHHESGAITSRLVVAEPVPAGWTVVEHRSEGITFSTIAEDWDRSPCNYQSVLE